MIVYDHIYIYIYIYIYLDEHTVPHPWARNLRPPWPNHPSFFLMASWKGLWYLFWSILEAVGDQKRGLVAAFIKNWIRTVAWHFKHAFSSSKVVWTPLFSGRVFLLSFLSEKALKTSPFLAALFCKLGSPPSVGGLSKNNSQTALRRWETSQIVPKRGLGAFLAPRGSIWMVWVIN